MKRIYSYITLAALMLTVLTGCNPAKQQLSKMVKQMNEECPMTLGDSGQLVSTTYKNDVVTLNYHLRGIEGLKNFDENYDMYHHMMLESYASTADTTFQAILKAIVAADASLDVVFRCEGEQEFRLSFSNKDLKSHLPGADLDPDTYLANFVEKVRMELPSQVGNGMMGTDIVLDDQALSYIFECDETLCDMESMKRSTVENHENMRDMMLQSTDPNTVKMLDMLRASHRGIRYVYRGTTSGTEAIFSVSPDEM